MAKEVSITITEENFSLLKGKWEGTKNIPGVGDLPCSLEIINNALPFKGCYYSNTSSAGGDSERPFENGTIEKGQFVVRWNNFEWMRLTFVRSEKGEILLVGTLAYSNRRGSGKCSLRFHKVS